MGLAMVDHLRFDPTSVINWLINALVFLGLVYIALYAVTLYFRYRAGKFDSADAIIRNIADDVSGAMLRIWVFVRPIMQLIIVLFVVFWFAQIVGINKDSLASFSALEIKTTLAIFVIGAFCIAAFLSDSPATWLKEIALVVIGFYFGTKAGP
jgi:uncharacterized membrane protein